jgi:hypothetical protein
LTTEHLAAESHLFGWTALEGEQLYGAREDGSVLTIGIFDGLHRGHQRILAAAETLAASAGLHRIHVGFDPHPDLLLRGAAPLRLLDPLEFELRFAAAGVEKWCDLPFDAAMRDTEWEPFLARLVAATGARSIVLSPESALGRGRQGRLELIRSWGATRGIQVHPVAEVRADGLPIRSTTIREAIVAGELSRAARALGRPHAITAQRTSSELELVVDAAGFALPPAGEYEVRIGAAAHRAGRLPLTGRVARAALDTTGRTLTLHPSTAGRLPEGAGRLRAAILRPLAGRSGR